MAFNGSGEDAPSSSLATKRAANTTNSADATPTPPKSSTNLTATNTAGAAMTSEILATSANMKPTSANSMTHSGSATFANSPPDDGKRHIFPFFDLPRELRDLAYDEMLVSHVGLKLECRLTLDAHNVVEPKLMTISRQFADEYMQCAEEKQTVAINDYEHVSLPAIAREPMLLPMVFQKATTLAVNIVGDQDTAFKHHKAWISRIITSMALLRSLSVKLVLCCEDQPFADQVHDFATLQKLTLLEVFARDLRYDAFKFDKQNLLVLICSADSCSWEKFEVKGIHPGLARNLASF